MLPGLQRKNLRAYDLVDDDVPNVHSPDQVDPALAYDARVSFPYSCWYVALDLIFGLLGTVLLVLILPFMSLLIYLDSPGPIFYSQERLGFRGKLFRIYKFRSMQMDAESGRQATGATKCDLRLTRIGKVLRATHMDELPQVFNILRRDMSLIGPRPEREVFATRIAEQNPVYRCRLAVKPGLTGWAQVKFGYGEGDQKEMKKLQFDLYYIQHRSCWLDVIIVLKTLVEVFRFHGR
ncbi:MAG TPA: sugar transferase [Ktedonobacteraceae bacterium]|nr:sugar transferase [Ktedonobacteraceae bacterium]